MRIIDGHCDTLTHILDNSVIYMINQTMLA